MQAMTGGYRYQNAISPASTNGLWDWAYQETLINIQTLIPIATARNLTTHVAMAKIFEAYVYLTLVDIYNDVPLSEALKGTNFSPKLDNAADVYAYAIARLGEARTELAKTGADVGKLPASDFYYPGLGAAARTNWTAVANTLELKAQMNLRMVSASAADARIDQLLASNIIDTEAENFTFKWGTATVPDSRHPLYNQYYGPNAGSAGGYIANYYLNELYQGRGVQDPRWRYYFYRQVGSIKPTVAGFDAKALGCTPGAPPPHYQAVGAVFCVFEPGFYGRDHGDASGTPPDGPVLTCAGVYPAGGRPDNNNVVNTSYNTPTQRGNGANGAGISPIWMYFYTDFLRSELAARRGDIVTARARMISGIVNSVDHVKKFSDGRSNPVTILPWSSQST
ncbi:MAG: SusD/RagB family nutrient-binding outer membrane lipoprotein, partial [Flammeovirgaceae bacterium]